MDFTDRTEKVLDRSGLEKLNSSHVAVFGLGGVGSFALEALVRAGVGELTIVDFDTVDVSNINRQLFALHSTIDEPKTEVARRRALDINPEVIIHDFPLSYSKENAERFDFSTFDFIVDAIDSVKDKTDLIEEAVQNQVPIISSMGMGNKLHPEMIQIERLDKTKMDPLAKTMRQTLKKRGITKIPVVYSEEVPVVKSVPPGSISTVPSTAGLIMASYVINQLTEN